MLLSTAIFSVGALHSGHTGKMTLSSLEIHDDINVKEQHRDKGDAQFSLLMHSTQLTKYGKWEASFVNELNPREPPVSVPLMVHCSQLLFKY